MDLDCNELLEKFRKSVVRIEIYRMKTDSHSDDPEEILWHLVTVIPGIVTMSGSNFCHIIVCHRGLFYANPSKYAYRVVFADTTSVEFDIATVRDAGWLAAFYVPTTGKEVDAVQFSYQNPSYRDKVWMFGYDHETQSLLDDGTITHVDDAKFAHDVPPNTMSFYGYPIFNMEAKLLGISYFDYGVTSTINVTQMTDSLSRVYGMVDKPLPEILDYIKISGEAMFGELQDSGEGPFYSV